MRAPKVFEEQACPRCGERKHVEAHFVEADGDVAWHKTTCLECGCEYTEIYEFACVELYEGNNEWEEA